ncbi:Ankyrin repeat-containing domain protein [Russula decolorans]|jgi:ankyrin repeat protein
MAHLVHPFTGASIRNKIRSNTLDTAQWGVDEDAQDESKTSFHATTEGGKIDVVKSLLERGVDINCRHAYSWTPLDGAAEKGNLDVVSLLIEWGAEVDSFEEWGWTPLPLRSASRYGRVEISRVLLEHGANVNANKQGHSTPLDLSARNGHLGVVELLFERGGHAYKR